jgi:hypothetical protein
MHRLAMAMKVRENGRMASPRIVIDHIVADVGHGVQSRKSATNGADIDNITLGRPWSGVKTWKGT